MDCSCNVPVHTVQLHPGKPCYSCQRCIAVLFWLFFKKIIHNSKSITICPFDLILILLGALAHFSQDRLFWNSVGCPLLVLVVCAFVSTALHCGHSIKSEIKFSGEHF